MRKLIPLVLFALGLYVADAFFGFDVPELFQGFGNFLLGLFKGAN
jgi:hypothetical protein